MKPILPAGVIGVCWPEYNVCGNRKATGFENCSWRYTSPTRLAVYPLHGNIVVIVFRSVDESQNRVDHVQRARIGAQREIPGKNVLRVA